MLNSSLQPFLLAAGIWRATLLLPAGELPFKLSIQEKSHQLVAYIYNGDEEIELTEISQKNDSLFLKLPVFDSEIKIHVSGETMSGVWINNTRKTNAVIPFEAKKNKSFRFFENPVATAQLPGKWEVHFSPGTKDSSFAIGLFSQKGSYLSATFLTTTGDYRFLEGCVNGDSLFLSCFDGAHAYLFKAKILGKKITGMYYSGSHWQEPWEASVNEKATLPDPYSITILKDYNAPFQFNALTTDSLLFTYPNEQLKDKVIVLQLMGTWCPNCLDETAYLSDFISSNKKTDFICLGLAFEKTNDFKKAASNVSRVKKRYQTPYEIMIAGNRENASEKMNMLSKINGYPTTIFIDKKGRVRKIHTGFNGPATGAYFEKEKDDFRNLIQQLADE
jgi:thiol-disulfide isomerase/thioredoxin